MLLFAALVLSVRYEYDYVQTNSFGCAIQEQLLPSGGLLLREYPEKEGAFLVRLEG